MFTALKKTFFVFVKKFSSAVENEVTGQFLFNLFFLQSQILTFKNDKTHFWTKHLHTINS